GCDLSDQHIAVAVEDQSGQAVGFPENQTVAGLAMQPLPQRQRRAQAGIDQLAADGLGRVTAEDSRADERVRIDVGVAQKLAALRPDLRWISRRERRERRGVGVDLIAENPEMSPGEATLFAAFQAQLRNATAVGAGGWIGRAQDGLRWAVRRGRQYTESTIGVFCGRHGYPTPERGRQPEIHQPADCADQPLPAPA